MSRLSAQEESTEMFGLFGSIAKRFNDQIADYAAAQADIARRLATEWQKTMTPLQPVGIESASSRNERLRRLARQDAASRRC
jgi:hypothetical protein